MSGNFQLLLEIEENWTLKINIQEVNLLTILLAMLCATKAGDLSKFWWLNFLYH